VVWGYLKEEEAGGLPSDSSIRLRLVWSEGMGTTLLAAQKFDAFNRWQRFVFDNIVPEEGAASMAIKIHAAQNPAFKNDIYLDKVFVTKTPVLP
jgi:hypothetical protein